MRNMLEKLKKLLFSKAVSAAQKRRKTVGQSLVEFAIALPIIFMLFTSVVEYGFVLNYYLSLLDATRESARLYSNDDPFLANGSDDYTFYSDAAGMVRVAMDPQILNSAYDGRRLPLDPAADDVIITVYCKLSGTIAETYPGGNSYNLYGNASPIVDDTYLQDRMISGSPNAGILVVEVHYNYHQVLNLPWLDVLGIPDPLPLKAYTIMPLAAAEPATACP